MSVITANPLNNNYQGWTTMNNFPSSQKEQPSVAISTPQGRQVYQYPQTSIYNDFNKNPAGGLNIYVFNPSGIGAPNTINNNYPAGESAIKSEMYKLKEPIANTPINNMMNMNRPSDLMENKADIKSPKKTKNIVKLTDDYIKTLESFLRSQDKSIRKQGTKDLIKRFEEDDSRYDNPSLTALLNIALQDPDANNRMLALSVIASGNAHGDENTINLVNGLTKSDKLYGQEAKLATSALLKTSQSRETVEDNSSDKPKDNDEKELD